MRFQDIKTECQFLAMALLMSLSACSGGGGATTATPNTTTTTTNTTTTNAAVTSPAVTGGTTAVFAAVATPSIATTRINFFRQLVGINPVTEDAALNQTAQNHVNYMINNNLTQLVHTETAGLISFTGASPLDRYVQVRTTPFYDAYVAESIGSYSDQYAAVDQLINSVYHQLPLLHAYTSHVGVASVATAALDGTIIDVVKPVNTVAMPLYVYPADGYSSAPIDFYGEIPDPLAGSVVVGQVAGGVMSMYAPSHVLVVSSASFTEVATGNVLVVETLDKNTDPHAILTTESVFFIPHQKLKPLTQYQMSVQYSLDGGATLTRTWRFTTA
ncbi:MAG: CAP domain-containing protein [Mariprofundaceae bacterium]|nr:CAP domain-containing protein [Mariprofundaceae bacterium]